MEFQLLIMVILQLTRHQNNNLTDSILLLKHSQLEAYSKVLGEMVKLVYLNLIRDTNPKIIAVHLVTNLQQENIHP